MVGAVADALPLPLSSTQAQTTLPQGTNDILHTPVQIGGLIPHSANLASVDPPPKPISTGVLPLGQPALSSTASTLGGTAASPARGQTGHALPSSDTAQIRVEMFAPEGEDLAMPAPRHAPLHLPDVARSPMPGLSPPGLSPAMSLPVDRSVGQTPPPAADGLDVEGAFGQLPPMGESKTQIMKGFSIRADHMAGKDASVPLALAAGPFPPEAAIPATVPILSGTEISSSAQVTNAPVAAGSPPISPAIQIAQAMTDPGRDPGAPLDLALDPPELGRVRLSFTEVNGTITLAITAERPETADLMRRHLGLLADEFARAGMDPPMVSISGGGADRRQDQGSATLTPSNPQGSARPDDDMPPERPVPSRHHARSGLDLRV